MKYEIRLGKWFATLIFGESYPEKTYPLVRRRVENTYEAAYYLMAGAKVYKTDERKLKPNHKEKFDYRWIFYMENIPENRIELWRLGRATGNIQDLQSWRWKLKKLLKG